MHTYEKLLDKIKKKEIVVWVGAGFSKYAGIPMGGELVTTIKNSCVEAEKRMLAEMTSLPDVAEEYVKMKNGRTELINLLKEEILKDIEKSKLTVHNKLSEITNINTIITTNYDNLFEVSYGNNKLNVIRTEEDVPVFWSDDNSIIKLVKMHSDFNNIESLVITQSDYTKFLDKSYDSLIWNKIKGIITEKSILFIGYSFDDMNARNLFQQIVDKLKEFSKESFLVCPDVPEYKVTNLSKYKISYINSTGEEIINRLYNDIIDNKTNNKCLKKEVQKKNIVLEESVSHKETKKEDDKVQSRLLASNLNQILNTCMKEVEINLKYQKNPYGEDELKMLSIPYKFTSEKECKVFFEEIPIRCKFKRCENKEHILINIEHEMFIIKVETKKINSDINEFLETLEVEQPVINVQVALPIDIYEGKKIAKCMLGWLRGETINIRVRKALDKGASLPVLKGVENQELIRFYELQEELCDKLIKIEEEFNVELKIPSKLEKNDISKIITISQYVEQDAVIRYDNLKVNTELFQKWKRKGKNWDIDYVDEKVEVVELFGEQIELGVKKIIVKDGFVDSIDIDNNIVVIGSETCAIEVVYDSEIYGLKNKVKVREIKKKVDSLNYNEYYIMSKAKSKFYRSNTIQWGGNNGGYTDELSKADIYTPEEIKTRIYPYHYDGGTTRNIAIPKAVVDTIFGQNIVPYNYNMLKLIEDNEKYVIGDLLWDVPTSMS